MTLNDFVVYIWILGGLIVLMLIYFVSIFFRTHFETHKNILIIRTILEKKRGELSKEELIEIGVERPD